jgi:hypothetical protein
MQLTNSPISSNRIKKTNNLSHSDQIHDELVRLASQVWTKDSYTFKDKFWCSCIVTLSGIIGSLIFRILNNAHVENIDFFHGLYEKNNRGGIGLLTVANHVHYLDDPLILATFMADYYLDIYKLIKGNDTGFQNLRWVPAETRNFFSNPNPFLNIFFRTFFGRGKVVPVTRGAGFQQLSHQRLESFLNRGDWVHIFGEGGRSIKQGEIRPFKPGVGKLIFEAPETIILPWAHYGVDQILPFGCNYRVEDNKTGKRIKSGIRMKQDFDVVFGEPFTLTTADRKTKTKAGYLELSEKVKSKVAACHKKARGNYYARIHNDN